MPAVLNLLFHLKYHATTLERHVLLTVQRFEHNALSPKFPGAISVKNMVKALQLKL